MIRLFETFKDDDDVRHIQPDFAAGPRSGGGPPVLLVRGVLSDAARALNLGGAVLPHKLGCLRPNMTKVPSPDEQSQFCGQGHSSDLAGNLVQKRGARDGIKNRIRRET